METETIRIKYFTEGMEKLSMIDKGDWCDLRSAEDVTLKAGEHRLISLGVGMILPEGYEAHIAPRSSTYKKWGIILANHIGVVDESYCGEDDVWMASVIAMRDTEIKKNDRICQFRIMKKQPKLVFEEVETLSDISRGGFGSTGTC